MVTSVLITGASGLVGTRLTEMLLQRGHRVSHLGRKNKASSVPSYVWDVNKGIVDKQALDKVDVIIHLAGAGVAEQRWSSTRKREILESRTASSALLFKTLASGNHQVKAIVSASAIGYYGIGTDENWKKESDPAGDDFLSRVVAAWEEEVGKIETLGLRVVKIRIGIVLSASGGALIEMGRPVRWGLGAALGSGRQAVSWIHIDDLCEIFIKAALDSQWSGAFNGVNPSPTTNAELTRKIASILHRPLWLPHVPGWFLRILVGEMADVVLGGSRVSAEKLLATGFSFHFLKLEDALSDLL